MTGKWVKDGTGTITQTADGPTWTYDTTHFTWWIVALVYTPNRCLTIRTCFDAACSQPAVNVPIMYVQLSNFTAAVVVLIIELVIFPSDFENMGN